MSGEGPKQAGSWKGWKKPVLFVLATAPIAVVAFSVVFMARYEMAFDESRCPYSEAEMRTLSDSVAVREDIRACQDGVEERRWVVLREGQEPLEIGRRPLDARQYGEGYRWTAEDEDGRVRVRIENPGLEPREFREPALDSGLR